jgi:hypothetical protein
VLRDDDEDVTPLRLASFGEADPADDARDAAVTRTSSNASILPCLAP